MHQNEWGTGASLDDVEIGPVRSAHCPGRELEGWVGQLGDRRSSRVAALDHGRPGPVRPSSRTLQKSSPRPGTSSVVEPVIVVEKALNMMAWRRMPATCSWSRSWLDRSGAAPASSSSSPRSETRGGRRCDRLLLVVEEELVGELAHAAPGEPLIGVSGLARTTQSVVLVDERLEPLQGADRRRRPPGAGGTRCVGCPPRTLRAAARTCRRSAGRSCAARARRDRRRSGR